MYCTTNNSPASTHTERDSHGGAGDDSGRATGGRPKGTTAKQNKGELLDKAITEASKQLIEARKGGRLKRGKVDELLRGVELQLHLENNSLDNHKHTIRTRADRNKPGGRGSKLTVNSKRSTTLTRILA
jgi:hypothetical protein